MHHANGHSPSWELHHTLSEINANIGRLQAGQELTRQEVHVTRQEMHAAIIRVHERIDNSQRRRTIPELTGMSVKELLTYAILIVLAINGTLSGETIAAWLAK